MKKILLNKPFDLIKYVNNTSLPFYMSNLNDYELFFKKEKTKGFLYAFKNLLESIEDKNLENLKNITELNLYNKLEKELNFLDDNNLDLKIENYDTFENLEEELEDETNFFKKNKDQYNFYDLIKNRFSWHDSNVNYYSKDRNIKFITGFNSIFGANIDRQLNSPFSKQINSIFNPKRTYFPNYLKQQDNIVLVCRMIFKTDMFLEVYDKETSEVSDNLKYNNNEKNDDEFNKLKLHSRIPIENIKNNFNGEPENLFLVQFETFENKEDWVITDFNGILNGNPFYS